MTRPFSGRAWRWWVVLPLVLIALVACGGGGGGSVGDPAANDAGTGDDPDGGGGGGGGSGGPGGDPPVRQPGVLQLEVVSTRVTEALTTIEFTVTRTGGADGEVSVDVVGIDGSARQGTDFNMIRTTARFPDGDALAKRGNVIIFDDSEVEADESFTLALVDPTGGATIGTAATATLTIVDDDTPPDPGAGFNHARGPNEEVTTIAQAKDGSGDVYIGGYFTTVNRSAAPYLARLKADGTVDTGFKIGLGFDGTVHAILPADDGSGDIYVGGEFTQYDGAPANRIVRLHRDGRIDAGFASGVAFDDRVLALALAADGSGRLYVGGAFTHYDGAPAPRLARLHADGHLDTTLAAGSGPNQFVRAIVPLADGSGRVYIGGYFDRYDGASAPYVARVLDNGALDTSFDTGLGFDNEVLTLAPALDGSGDLFVGGWFGQFKGLPTSQLVRLTSKGSLNGTFSAAGMGGSARAVGDVHPVADGSGDVVVAGSFQTYAGQVVNGLMRLDARGQLRRDFVTAGAATSAVVNRVLPAAHGGLLVAGAIQVYRQRGVNNLLRIHGDGGVDETFAVLGGGASADVYAVAPTGGGDGAVYVGGEFDYFNGAPAPHLVRLGADGAVDAGFATGAGFNSAVHALTVAGEAGGGLFVGGQFTSYDGQAVHRLVRLHDDGSLDTTFAPSPTTFDSSVDTITEVGDGSGRLYVGGRFRGGIARLHADGSLDSNFNVGAGFQGAVLALAMSLDGSGDVYVGGEFVSYDGKPAKHLVRLNPDGSIDTGFDVGSGFDFWVTGVLPADKVSGDVYVGGWFSTYKGLAAGRLLRLNSDGSVDAGFAVGSGFDQPVTSLSLAGDGSGSLYVGGAFGAFDGQPVNNLARLHPDGRLDPTFDSGAGLNWRVANALAPAGDGSGDLFVGGYFTSYDTTTVNHLLRLDADGSLD